MVNRKLLKVKFPLETGNEDNYEVLNYDNDVQNREERGQNQYEDELVEYVFIPGIPGVNTRTVGEVPRRVRTDLGNDNNVPRRSQRQTRGQHSNPFRLPKSSIR